MNKLSNFFSNKEKLSKYLFLISIISIGIIILTYIICGALDVFDTLRVSIFADFAETIASLGLDNPYDVQLNERACIYPPIVFILLYPFYIICKKDMNNILSGVQSLEYIYKKPMFILSFSLFFLIVIGLSCLFIYKSLNTNKKTKVFIILSFILSGPIYYSFTRGNTIILSFLFFLIFYYLYNKEKRLYQIIGLLFLGLSISLKVYPILMIGILFYKKGFKKGFIDILICGLFTIVLVFLPFIFFGGFKSIKMLINNALNFSNDGFRNGAFRNISFFGLLYSINEALHFIFGINIYTNILNIISTICVIIISIISILLPIILKNKMKVYFLAVVAYSLFANITYAYVIINMFVAFIIYINELEDLNDTEKISYGLLYFIAFNPLMYIFYLIKLYSVLVIIYHGVITKRGIKNKEEVKSIESTNTSIS